MIKKVVCFGGCFFLLAIVFTIYKSTGISLGGLWTGLLFGGAFAGTYALAGFLYKKWDIISNKKNTATNNCDCEDKYNGEMKDGQKHGKGTMTYSNGGVYVGEWKDDRRHGQGTMTFNDGSRIVGVWKDDKFVS